MTYVDGFLVAVPTANKQKYTDHAESALPLFKEFGVARMVEGWGDDVPRGEVNDLYGAVQAKDDEAVLFSWVEYPDKATRNAAGEKMMNDPRMKAIHDMPFDGQRMVYGGFELLHEDGPGGACGYIDGVVTPVPETQKDAYRAYCAAVDEAFLEHGATRVVDTWGDDISDGKVTDFRRTVKAEPGEAVAFGWVEWPSKQVRDAAWEKLMSDERLAPSDQRPFDGKRMVFGSFTPLVDR